MTLKLTRGPNHPILHLEVEKRRPTDLNCHVADPTPSRNFDGPLGGTISYGDNKVPFELELTQAGQDVTASFFNGDDRITSRAGRLSGDSLTVDFDHYATHLNATVSNRLIKGSYGGKRSGMRDFQATPHVAVADSTEKAPNIAGIWDLPGESPKGEHAWQLIVRQNGNAVEAAILRVDGDTGQWTGWIAQEEAHILHHIGDGGLQAAVCVRDSGIEIKWLLGELVSGAQITRRNMRLQEIRGAIEVALCHAERHQNIFIDVDLVIVAGEPLDDLAEENIPEIGIAPLCARTERYMRV